MMPDPAETLSLMLQALKVNLKTIDFESLQKVRTLFGEFTEALEDEIDKRMSK